MFAQPPLKAEGALTYGFGSCFLHNPRHPDWAKVEHPSTLQTVRVAFILLERDERSGTEKLPWSSAGDVRAVVDGDKRESN